MKTVGIIAPFDAHLPWDLFDILEEGFDVRFEVRKIDDEAGIDAWFFYGVDFQNRHVIANCDRPCYAVISSVRKDLCDDSLEISFSRDPSLTPGLIGQKILLNKAGELKSLPDWLSDTTTLATQGGYPVWKMRQIQGICHHFVSWAIPLLSNQESPFHFFQQDHFLKLIPLLHFLRTLSEDASWDPPPLQACFMFDDPNLHWLTYGFIDFSKILHHAKKHRHHVSFATIPIDSWFAHKSTASLFRQNQEYLSLLIHGNNHTHQELACPCSVEEQYRIVGQALARIKILENRTGLQISKIMAPPHGAYSESFLGVSAHLGFEAACVSGGSLRRHNERASWTCSLGMHPTDIIAGLPIFPRFRLSKNCHTNILAAAFFNQPIIPAGHHPDVANGLQLLTETSKSINSLGSVQWANMMKISRAHFARMIVGKTLCVKMFTRRIEIIIPENITQVQIELSRLKKCGYESFVWRNPGRTSEWFSQNTERPISVESGQRIEILLTPPRLAHKDAARGKSLRLWPYTRRVLTEFRDRVTPSLSWLRS